MGTQFFWIFDVSVVVIFLGYIFIGIRKGFISVLLNLLALVLAFCMALFTSGGIAEAIYDNMISDAITEEKYGINTLILSSVLAEEIKNGTALGVITDIIDTVADSLPFFASDSTPQTGTEIGSVIEKIAVSMLTTTHTDNLANRITDDIIRPVLLVPMRTLIFVIIFVIILVIVHLIARLFRTINHIPVIGGINKLFGAVAGFAQGAIVIFLVFLSSS